MGESGWTGWTCKRRADLLPPPCSGHGRRSLAAVRLIVGAARSDPNSTTAAGARIDGAHNCSSGCLFNVATDRGEHEDLAATNSQRVADMTQLLAEESERFFVNRDRGTDACPDGIEMSCGCWMAINKYGGAFGPFQNVTPP